MTPYYENESITIYHGDCRDVLPTLAPVDCLVTSPPYNCGMDYGQHDDDQPVPVYLSWFEDCYALMANAVASGGFACVNVPSWIGSREEQIYAFDEYKAIADRHLLFHDLIIWAKQAPSGQAWGNYANNPRIRANHEWVLVHRGYGPPRGHSDVSWPDWSRLTQSVWTIPAVLPLHEDHPATFPMKLPLGLISLYCPAGGVVLDPFAGVGTTLVAAQRLGRRAIGIEISERYCAMAAERLGQRTLFAGS